MARFLGEGIDQSVANQIEARGRIMSRSPRNESDLKYLNQRTGWVRVTSMVNVGDSSEEAKELILQGGTVRLSGDSLALRGGISFEGSSGAAYSTTGAIGTRPMPGITEFNIVSKNRFGTIREANVSFNAWSVEDLKLVEQLYFRVGYSCVIEWGHSVYVNEDGTVENARATANYKDFFSKGTRDTLQEKISAAKKATNHNYDGLIGLISNFTWGVRKDGGYDCSIKVISLGEVISSIKASRAMTDFEYLPGDETKGEVEEDVAMARKSPFHLLVYILAKADITPPTDSGLIGRDEVKKNLPKNLQKTWENIWTQLRKPVDFGGLGDLPNNLFIGKKYQTMRFGNIVSTITGGKAGQSTKTYISLRTFLALINRYYLLKDDTGKTVTRFETADSGNEPKYRTYKGHYSADPWTVLIPTSERKINGIQLPQATLNRPDEKIYNIFVNLEYIVEKLDPLINEENSEINVYEFIRSVIDGLEAPLGDINDFDITYDEDEALYSIIDRNNIVSSGDKAPIPTVDLTGLKTTVTDLTIESKITDKLVATVAIAAQAEPKGYAEILASQVAWNAGYKDRILPTKIQTIDEQAQVLTNEAERIAEEQEKINKRKEKYENLLEKTYGKLNEKDVYKTDDWNGLLPESRFYQTNAINSGSPTPKQPLAGVVPVEVAFTLDGISSLKIGELFKIPTGFLPPRYEIFSYIVTGLEHSIDGGKWMSKIKANPIVYPPQK
jgi:hypothetical protein